MVNTDITIVILSYKRLNNVLAIVKTLQPYFSRKIIIINNNPDINIPGAINNTENKWCINRWHKINNFVDSRFVCVIDDDILPTPNNILKMRDKSRYNNQSLIGIYGKTELATATKYEDLKNHWCVDKEVDLMIGSCILTLTYNIKAIFKEYIKPWGIQDRGDDLLISQALTHKYGVKHYTVAGQVLMLPEGVVALSAHPDHYKKRWQVIQDFRRKYNGKGTINFNTTN